MTLSYGQRDIRYSSLDGQSRNKLADGERNEFRRFFGPPSGLKSKPGAERWGLRFAQQWIDNGKPELNK
jgi:hypothetical protein